MTQLAKMVIFKTPNGEHIAISAGAVLWVEPDADGGSIVHLPWDGNSGSKGSSRTTVYVAENFDAVCGKLSAS